RTAAPPPAVLFSSNDPPCTAVRPVYSLATAPANSNRPGPVFVTPPARWGDSELRIGPVLITLSSARPTWTVSRRPRVSMGPLSVRVPFARLLKLTVASPRRETGPAKPMDRPRSLKATRAPRPSGPTPLTSTGSGVLYVVVRRRRAAPGLTTVPRSAAP